MMKRGQIVAMSMTVSAGFGLVGCGVGTHLGQPASVVTAAGVPICTAHDLSVHGGREGENMGAHMDVLLRNKGAAACVLRGLPVAARLVPRDGSVLATRLTTVSSNLVKQAVLLKPRGQNAGDLLLYWGNWCGPAPGPLQIKLTLPGGRGTVSGSINGPPDYDYVPQCIQPNQPSTLQILAAYLHWR